MTLSNQINTIEKDIKSITIQGATNVALATLEGIKLFVLNFKGNDCNRLLEGVKNIAERLSEARENEPLARNVSRYLSAHLEAKGLEETKKEITDLCNSYESIIDEAKRNIIKFGTEALQDHSVILNHCHSSSSMAVLKNVSKYRDIHKKGFKVIVTETRPLYQGRKSAKELSKFGIETTLVVDSAAASFIVSDTYEPVSAVIVGCDELLLDGSFINKVGTFSLAIAAEEGADKFYVATTLLKLAVDKRKKDVKIEQRDLTEVWEDAPKDVEIINPAFEQVNSKYVSGYITEVGVLKEKELISSAKEVYPWLFI